MARLSRPSTDRTRLVARSFPASGEMLDAHHRSDRPSLPKVAQSSAQDLLAIPQARN